MTKKKEIHYKNSICSTCIKMDACGYIHDDGFQEKCCHHLHKNRIIENGDIITLIQCYYRTRDSDDRSILKRSDAIVDKINIKYKELILI